jgi:hypothetical protein
MQDINNFNIRNVIDNVFNKLNENAIHAKQNYFVTASPGLSSLIAEAENINGKIGVAFYTEQLTKYAENEFKETTKLTTIVRLKGRKK